MAARITPLVVVLGATGAGKSKLALDIAKVFKAEIISADSMQIYKGLDIITNKVTEEEQRVARHHLIGYLEPSSRNNTVQHFRNKALPIIDELLKDQTMPIIVGGTNYYIESLLWEFLVDTQVADQDLNPSHDVTPQDGSGKDSDSQTSRPESDVPSPKRVKLTEADIPHRRPDVREFPEGRRIDDSVCCRLGDSPPQETSRLGYLDSNPHPSSSSFSDPGSSSDTHPGVSDRITLSGTERRRDVSVTGNEEVVVSRAGSSSAAAPSHIGQPGSAMTPVTSDEGHRHVGQDEPPSDDLEDGPPSRDPKAVYDWLAGQATEELYRKLQELDAPKALRQHPNDRRKIIRALQVFYETGTPISTWHKDQHGGVEGAVEGVKSGPLRYPDPCILWVRCQPEVLNQRLDSRVDAMMSRGLVRELEEFHRHATGMRGGRDGEPSTDYPHGILQTIGFKEFHDYLLLPQDQRDTEQGRGLLQKGVRDLKAVTRRYARKQERWIRNRFCSRPGPNVPPVYTVDSTDVTKWDEAASEAIEVVRAFLQGIPPTKQPEPSETPEEQKFQRNVCEACGGRVFLTSSEWRAHLKTKKHQHHQKKLRKAQSELSRVLEHRKRQLSKMESGPCGRDDEAVSDLTDGPDDNPREVPQRWDGDSVLPIDSKPGDQ